jgi:hypothetical protein
VEEMKMWIIGILLGAITAVLLTQQYGHPSSSITPSDPERERKIREEREKEREELEKKAKSAYLDLGSIPLNSVRAVYSAVEGTELESVVRGYIDAAFSAGWRDTKERGMTIDLHVLDIKKLETLRSAIYKGDCAPLGEYSRLVKAVIDKKRRESRETERQKEKRLQRKRKKVFETVYQRIVRLPTEKLEELVEKLEE